MDKLTEKKREVRRYYLRPFNEFAANKKDILKLLIENNYQNCTIYTLNNLGDDKDVTKLTTNDIIYYYDDGILYDKNHVRILDYDLFIKHEENRKKFIGKPDMAKPEVRDEYEDRVTEINTEIEESLNEDKNNDFITKAGQKDPYLRLIWELMHTDAITGEKLDNPRNGHCYTEVFITDNGKAHGHIRQMTGLEEKDVGFFGLAIDMKNPKFLDPAKAVADELKMPWVFKAAKSPKNKNSLFIDFGAIDEVALPPRLYQYDKYAETRAAKLADKATVEKETELAPESSIPKNNQDNPLNLEFEDVNIFGEKLVEGKETGGICCICGEEIDGDFGHNPEPYMSAENGRCCSACNANYVIPARFEAMAAQKALDKQNTL